MPSVNKEEFLTQTWLRDMNADIVHAVAEVTEILHLADGHCLFNRGDKPLAFYGVVTGAVRFTRVNHAGKEMILDVAVPGAFFGEISILGDKRRGYDAQCSGDTQLLALRTDDFRMLFETYHDFRWLAVRKLCARINVYYDSFEDVFLLKLPARIAKRIVALARAQDAQHKGDLILDAGLSQENLASMLGITRQSLSKQLTEWRNMEWIDIQYGRIVIRNIEALQAISEERSDGNQATCRSS
jgi:CRP/FNR family transcriptional regulator, cyclic AMP receptor protein